ncbi:hypothetical protein [Catenulispora subtropica]|uniref:ABM domain-containing protein n=1 Tax=Catenulispora subtropica TaxID=450798 RepID=A0ABP5DVS6_9ACTN
MSVFMTMQLAGDPQGLRKYAQDYPEKMRDILEAAKRHGLIAHRFYGSEDGTAILVLDEWPERQNFEAFFQEQEATLRPMFEVANATGQPSPVFWHELQTNDAYGWGA